MKILGIKGNTQVSAPRNSEWPVFNISNVNVGGAQLVNNIWWNQLGTEVHITADVALPNAQVMIMVERVIDGTVPVDDLRTIARIESGKIFMDFTFPLSGNYMIRTDRLNDGLTRIGSGFYVEMDDIEFDVYI